MRGWIMKISVFGAGYVGLVSAACLADMGNSVMCVDVDADRVKSLRNGQIPIHEPGLEELVRRNAATGRLTFSDDPALAVSHGTLLFVAVGTPPLEDGSADLAHVLAVARSIGQHMHDYKVVVNKSTVPVGTVDRVRETISSELRLRETIIPFAVVSNPEFLKEGDAIADFMHPDRVVVGSDDEQATLLMRALYAPFLRNRDRVLIMDARSAEMTKYVANAMLASRISFMNEMAGLAERLGADIEQIRAGIGADPRIGTHFLYAGCGWGGSCFPKDVRALARMGEESGTHLQIIDAVRKVNDDQKRVMARRIRARWGDDLTGLTFGVWGLAFKPGTDDLREAPSLVLIEELLASGAQVKAFDPVAMPGAASRWPGHPGFHLVGSPLAAAEGASGLCVVTEWREFRSPDFDALRQVMLDPVIFDGRNLYDPARIRAMGFEHVGIGRGSSASPADGATAWVSGTGAGTQLAKAA
jgi:UDPglucose 6-dehydrogenase